jgi:hypothetical protein
VKREDLEFDVAHSMLTTIRITGRLLVCCELFLRVVAHDYIIGSNRARTTLDWHTGQFVVVTRWHCCGHPTVCRSVGNIRFRFSNLCPLRCSAHCESAFTSVLVFISRGVRLLPLEVLADGEPDTRRDCTLSIRHG